MTQNKIRALINRYIKLEPSDPDVLRKRKTLNIALLLLLLIDIAEIFATLSFLLLETSTLDDTQGILFLCLLFLGVCFILFPINNRYSNTVASIAFLVILVILICFSDSPENLTQGRSLFVWIFPVVVASIVMASPCTSFIMSVFISGLLTAISLINGEMPNIYAIGVLVLAGLLIWFLTSTLQKALTYSRQNEQKLQKTRDDQVRLIDQLLKASKFKSEFMATMSHELRTPLNAIIGFSDVLVEGLYGKLTDDQLDFVNTILTSSEHLLHLVNQFLDISKIESGKLTTNIHPIILNDLVNELVIELKPLYAQKGLRINLEGFESQSIVYADPVQLKEILLNLVNNAITYTMNGSIDIAFHEDENIYTISVSDTGIGIAEKNFPRIFKEFERIEEPGTASKGTGLGLALTRRLVNLHGGEIGFTSKIGKGTTFSFTLPKSLKGIMEANFHGTLPVGTILVEAINVLIIEDNRDDMEVIKNFLQEIKTLRFDIHSASNLTNGVDYLKKHDDVHLILLDLLLPETEGLETAQAVIDLGLKIPLIIITVIDDRILAAEIIRKGAQDYLVKSELNPNSLEKSIRLAFERFKLTRQQR